MLTPSDVRYSPTTLSIIVSAGTSPAPCPAAQRSGWGAGAIAGVSVGAVIVSILAILALVFVGRRIATNRAARDNAEMREEQMNDLRKALVEDPNNE